MRARCDPGGLWRLDSVMCRSSGFAAFARGFAFGLALVFALAFGFAIAYSPTFALRVSPRPGGAPDTACPGATDDPASPPLPGGASSPALRASAARTRAARFPNGRSEEHTSELQSHSDLVCRLLLEKKNKHG